MTFLIIGGSSGVGCALAKKFAAAGNQLVLISQDFRDTQAMASHLQLIYNVKVTPIEVDLTKPGLPYDKIDHALYGHSPLMAILAPVGLNDSWDKVGSDDLKLERIHYVNYLSPVKIINYYLPEIKKNSGTIVGFGSVATARGRTKNAAYAAAKSSLESYFDSLMHYSSNTMISVQFYILGYLDTNLAFAEKLIFPLGSSSKLAQLVFMGIGKEGKKIFFPRYWLFIYRIVQFMPWKLFKKLSF